MKVLTEKELNKILAEQEKIEFEKKLNEDTKEAEKMRLFFGYNHIKEILYDMVSKYEDISKTDAKRYLKLEYSKRIKEMYEMEKERERKVNPLPYIAFVKVMDKVMDKYLKGLPAVTFEGLQNYIK